MSIDTHIAALKLDPHHARYVEIAASAASHAGLDDIRAMRIAIAVVRDWMHKQADNVIASSAYADSAQARQSDAESARYIRDCAGRLNAALATFVQERMPIDEAEEELTA